MKRDNPTPPKWADQFLSWFCAETLLEEIQGDLHEAFYHRVPRKGVVLAKLLFILDVFTFFKPYAFEKYSRAKQFLPMFNNYFKISLRNILHRRSFTLINLLGLTFGISAVMIISLYLKHEYTYDQNIPQHQQVYRLMNQYRAQVYSPMFFKDYYQSTPETQLGLVNYMRKQDDVEQACHFVLSQSAIGGGDQFYVKYGQQQYIGENILFTNTGLAFQDIFPQDFLKGQPETAFNTFNTVILTERLAQRWFGNQWIKMDLVGKSLIIRNEHFNIGGVVATADNNQHFDFDWIIYQESIPSWGAYTYFRIKPSASAATITERLNKEIDSVYPGHWEDELQKGITAIQLKDIHFKGEALYELKPLANQAFLNTFTIVGILILLVIWINYTNLSIAMYSDRQKELGIRKVLGARKQDISIQLFTESILLALICFPISLLLINISLPYFNNLMNTEIASNIIFSPLMISWLLGLFLISGIISVAYPALFYGGKPMLQLFGKRISISTSNRHFSLRNVLLTLQFAAVIGLISLTFFIYQQMQYIQTKDLGFQRENIIFFGINGAKKYNQLKSDLLKLPEIQAIGSNGVPGAEMYNQLTYKLAEKEVVFSDGTQLYLGSDYFEALNMRCEACDDMLKNKDNVFVINQTAADKLAKVRGCSPNDLIGEILITEPEWENKEFGNGIPHTIDGIIQDFDYFSLRHVSQPLLIEVYQQPEWIYTMLVRAQTNDWENMLKVIQKAYVKIEPDLPFDYSFLDTHLSQLYKGEQRSGYLLALLSILIITLALIGLGGIVTYVAYTHRKEVSIRKVLGANIWNILLRFNKEFIILLGIATFAALPLTLYAIRLWLKNFAYSIQPQWWIIVLTGLMMVFIIVAIISISVQRVVRSHPIKALSNSQN